MNDKFTPKDYYFFLSFLFLSILIITSGGGADFTHYLVGLLSLFGLLDLIFSTKKLFVPS